MSLRTPPTDNEETSLRYRSLLGAGVIEVSWAGDEEPLTRRSPAEADHVDRARAFGTTPPRLVIQDRAA